MNALTKLLQLEPSEKASRGLEHTPREIAQQPETWGNTLTRITALSPQIRDFLAAFFAADGRCTRRVRLIGAGSSDYTGRALVHLLRRRWRCSVGAMPSTDLVTDLQGIPVSENGELWISFSRSGETPEGVAVLERALESYPGVKHIVISCDENGTMLRRFAKHSNVFGICLGEEANDRGMAMTSSVTNMIIAGQCLAHLDSLDVYAKTLASLVSAGREAVSNGADPAFDAASGRYKHAAFVGSGPLHAVATESALKVLELTAGSVRTQSESVLGFRHGPIASVGKDSLVVSYLPSEAHARRHTLDLLREIRTKQLAGKVVLTAWHAEDDREIPADVLISMNAVTPIDDDCRAPVDVIFGQMFGLFASIASGLMPDSPSPNGAINRVVQGVRL